VIEAMMRIFDRIAAQGPGSTNTLVTRSAEDLVALDAWQRRKIEAGIAAADAGDFASDEELARIQRKFPP
jgi:predicted transcriptional regulator